LADDDVFAAVDDFAGDDPPPVAARERGLNLLRS
jgi:hypothetical protein